MRIPPSPVAIALRMFFLLAITTLSQAQIYHYNTTNQGWQQARIGYHSLSYENLSPFSPANWTGLYGVGSPDGSIQQSSSGTSWESRPYTMFIQASGPSAILGNLTGQTLAAYFRSTANWRGRVATDTVYLRWSFGILYPDHTANMWVSKASFSINLNESSFGTGTDADWVLKVIVMDQSNFFKWPNASAPGTFSDALINYNFLGLTILPTASGNDDLNNFNGASGTWGSGYTLLHYGATATSGTATWGVDRLGLHTTVIPEPATLPTILATILLTLALVTRHSLHRLPTHIPALQNETELTSASRVKPSFATGQNTSGP